MASSHRAMCARYPACMRKKGVTPMTQQMNSGTNWPAPLFHNQALAKLVHESYTPAQLEQIRKELVEHGTLSIRRYAGGGCSAVTVLDLLKQDSTVEALAKLNGDRAAIARYLTELSERSERTLLSALDGLLIFEWDRDSTCQSIAELAIELDPALGAGLNLKDGTWKQGLLGVLKHHFKTQDGIARVIKGPDKGGDSGMDMSKGPTIRWNPSSKLNLDAQTRANLIARWGNRQNDSVGFDQWLLFYAIN